MSNDTPTNHRPGLLGVSVAAPNDFLDLLADLGTQTTLEEGQDLFRQGDEADGLFVLLDGLVEISTLSRDGRKLAHILLKPGTVFGEIALFDGGRRSATVTAKKPLRLIQIRRDRLLTEIQENPELAIQLLRLAIGRMRWMTEQLDDYAFQSVETRLARKLVFLSQTIGENDVIRMSQSDLAEHVGATREAVSKALAELKYNGIVDIGRGSIVLRDTHALEALASLGSV